MFGTGFHTTSTTFFLTVGKQDRNKSICYARCLPHITNVHGDWETVRVLLDPKRREIQRKQIENFWLI